MKECFKINNLRLVFGNKTEKAFFELENEKSISEILREHNQVVAVNNVNLSVFNNEILVIMGLSGSGKSSLLRCLNGMNGRNHGKAKGNIYFTDKETEETIDILNCSKEEIIDLRKNKISMVFQQFGLMPWKNVEENIAFPLEIKKTPKNQQKEEISEKIHLVGLSQWAKKYPHELSGGMQQRVGIARAFVTNSQILLMDEPFSALDPLHRRHLQEEILLLQSKLNKTIVFVTHDFQEALNIGTRIAIMDSGKLLQIGTPKDIINNPSCEIVKKFTYEYTHLLEMK